MKGYQKERAFVNGSIEDKGDRRGIQGLRAHRGCCAQGRLERANASFRAACIRHQIILTNCTYRSDGGYCQESFANWLAVW